jgi:hypothetical protein
MDLIDSPLIPSLKMMIKRKKTRKTVNSHLLASKTPKISRQSIRKVTSPAR